MTARQRVIAALGGRCAWCQSTAGPFEIDHIHGGGNQHRAQLKEPIERWLCRVYDRTGVWPASVQLLCQRCHARKSGRRKAMPAREGHTRQHLSLPDDLVEALKVLATQRGETLSAVVAAAIRSELEGRTSQALIASFQQRLDGVYARLVTLEQTLTTLVAGLGDMRTQLASLSKDHDKIIDAANCFYDYVDGHQGKHVPPGSRLKQWFGAR